MVVEIALGIVLAVVILACLPLVFAIGLALLPVAIALLILGGIGLLIYTKPAFGFAIAALAGTFVGIAAIGYGLTKLSRLALDEAMGVVFLVGLYGMATFSVIEEYFRWGVFPESAPWVALFGVAVVAVLIVIFRRIKDRPRLDNAPRTLNAAEKDEWARRHQLGYTDLDQGDR